MLRNQREQGKTFKVTKGMRAEELLTALKDDFMEHGMDAYKQFKRVGAGIDLTDADLAYTQTSDTAHRDAVLALQRQERDQK